MKKFFLLFFLCTLGVVAFTNSVSAANAVSDTLTTVKTGISQVSQTPLPSQGISFESVFRGVIGMLSLILIAFIFSRNRKAINWKIVLFGLITQLVLAFSMHYIPFVASMFGVIGKMFVKIMDFSLVGATFLFSGLIDVNKSGYIFVFQVLPSIIFFSALASLLYYLNVIQFIVKILAKVLSKTFGISGPESLCVAGNLFLLGQSESPLLIKKYMPTMTRSEIFLIYTSGMATIAGGVLSAYIGMLGGDDPQQRVAFAKYLISASVMAAPAAIVFAKMIMPQVEPIEQSTDVEAHSVGSNVLDSISNGTTEGIRIAVAVSGMLLVFIALMAFLNYILGGLIGNYSGLNTLITNLTDGTYKEFNFQFILGMLFTPLTWLMGVCNHDTSIVGSLLGTKIILNEFVAYSDLSVLKASGAFLQEKSIVMTTYILCGFANISSIGIQVGVLGTIAPNKKEMLTQIGMPALLAGTLASCLSATIIGMILG